MAVGVAALAGTLFVAGFAAYAAATAPGDPELVSVSWTGPNDAPGDHAITTTAAPALVVNVPSTATGSGGGVQHTLDVAVLPGPLTVEPPTESVSLLQVRPFGLGEPYLGGLSPITVVDARGSLVGWRATVSLQAIPGLDARQLAQAELCVTPRSPTMVAGNPGDVVRGAPRSCAGTGRPIPVFWAAPGGGGGTYSDSAGLALIVPGWTSSGRLTASLAVAVS